MRKYQNIKTVGDYQTSQFVLLKSGMLAKGVYANNSLSINEEVLSVF